MKDKLTNEMIKDLANRLGIEPALLKAVQIVEAAGRDGFLSDGRPQILFEGHIMYKEFHKKFPDRDLAYLCKKFSMVFYPKWDKSKYFGGLGEYKRLELAKEIDEECALKATSWGMFQIMGFNHNLCGCKDVFDFVHKMSESHEKQLELMYYFMNNSGCLKELKEKDWAGFAKKYNGPGYAQNAYDQKLRNAYENFKNKL
jgi:hypothetical protein